MPLWPITYLPELYQTEFGKQMIHVIALLDTSWNQTVSEAGADSREAAYFGRVDALVILLPKWVAAVVD